MDRDEYTHFYHFYPPPDNYSNDPRTNRFYTTSLIAAIEQDNLELVKACIQKKSNHGNPNVFGYYGNNYYGGRDDMKEAFIAAIKNENLEIIKCLIDHGADTNSNNETLSPLSVAITNNCYLEVIKLLVTNGANVNSTFVPEGDTPLTMAIDLENLPLLEYLIKQGADVNKNGRYGNTPLSCAVTIDNFPAVKILIDNGADENKANYDGNTALGLAQFLERTEIIRYMENNSSRFRYSEHHYHVDDFDDFGVSKLQISTPFAQSQNTFEENTPLGRAILSGKLATIKALLIAGADSCEPGTNGKSPLLLAVQCKNLQAIKLLLDYGAEFTIQTAFLESINLKYIEITKYLLQRGVQINLTYRNGSTPLIKSIEANNFEIVKALVEKGANVNMTDRDDNLPLSISLKKGNLNIAQFLVNKGATINEKYLEANNDLQTVQTLQQLGVEFKTILAKNKHLLLSKAVQANNFPMVKYLVEQGAQVNQSNDGKEVPLLTTAAANRNFRIVKCLIDGGAKISMAKKELEEFANCNEDFAIYLQNIKRSSCFLDDFKYGEHESAN